MFPVKHSRIVVVGNLPFIVPPRIQRCGPAWQVRYRGTVLFSDGTAGPRASLRAATIELMRRYGEVPPKQRSGLRDAPLRHKSTDLPAGISGPVLVHKPGRGAYAEFKVSLPRRGRPNGGTSVYIAAESTWSQDRYDAALAKAIARRDAAVRALNR
jgi:hypothetical protein